MIENKKLKVIIVVILLIISVMAIVIVKKRGNFNKCGDGVCDEKEQKNLNLCSIEIGRAHV